MALLNKSGIINGNTILPAHVTNVYDALNGTGSYDVVATGSFTGSFVGNLTGTATFSNTASFVTASSISGPYGANSVISASYSVSASHLIGGINIDTGSLVTTASFNAYTGSAASQFAGTASFATTASHALTVATASIKTSGTTLYSTDPATSGFSTQNGIFLGAKAGGNATNAYASIFLGDTAGTSASSAFSSNFIGATAGFSASNAINSNFIGQGAGFVASASTYSNFIGYLAGHMNNAGYGPSYSNFIGSEAGRSANNASNSNFIGSGSGFQATNAYRSNFIGQGAGYQATNAYRSNFFGFEAGYQATNANDSVFIGLYAGRNASASPNSIFIGNAAGYQQTSNASYSTYLGYQTGYNGGSNNLGSNNIIIGTNISLPNARNNSINLGGVIFATGSYSTTTGNPYTGSQANSRVGIAKDLPNATLDVAGNTIISGSLTATNQILISTGSATAPSYTFINDSNTGIYSSGSTNIIRFATNGADTARISSQQLIIGDNTFVSNTNYAQAGVQVNGLLYATDGVFHNVFFHPSNYYARGVANKGGIYFQYLNTSSIVAPENGEKIVFRTIPSGSAVGVAVSSSDALRIDPNYIDSGEYQPNFEIANRLTLGQLWSGTNTGIGRDSTTGQITAVSSDQRLKTNIQTLTGSLDAIKSLRGTQFEWTNENDPEFRISSDATGTQIGLIAQEVEQILPQVVKPNGVKDYLTVEYDKIVAVLIEAIKEQQQQIDNLQQQINNM